MAQKPSHAQTLDQLYRMPQPIQILSDLHLHLLNPPYKLTLTPKAPNLALIGNIGPTTSPHLFTFLRSLLSLYKTIFYIPGPTEAYDSTWTITKSTLTKFQDEVSETRLRNEEGGLGKFVLLDQGRYDLDEKGTILGCTLFSLIPNNHHLHNQLTHTHPLFQRTKSWTPQTHNTAFQSDLSYLNTTVAQIKEKEPSRMIMILTAFCPSTDLRVLDPDSDSGRDGYNKNYVFRSDLKGQRCWESDNVKVWGYGNTGWNCDWWDVGGWGLDGVRVLRVVSEQRGDGGSGGEVEGWEGGVVVSI